MAICDSFIFHNPSMTEYASQCNGVKILNFQNTFDHSHLLNLVEIRIPSVEDADKNFFGILISTRLSLALILIGLKS